MKYTIDELVELQFASDKLRVAAVLLQGVSCSIGEINCKRFVEKCELEIKEAMQTINEVGPR